MIKLVSICSEFLFFHVLQGGGGAHRNDVDTGQNEDLHACRLIVNSLHLFIRLNSSYYCRNTDVSSIPLLDNRVWKVKDPIG